MTASRAPGKPETANPEAYAQMLKANFAFNQSSQSPRERYATAAGFLARVPTGPPLHGDVGQKAGEWQGDQRRRCVSAGRKGGDELQCARRHARRQPG